MKRPTIQALILRGILMVVMVMSLVFILRNSFDKIFIMATIVFTIMVGIVFTVVYYKFEYIYSRKNFNKLSLIRGLTGLAASLLVIASILLEKKVNTTLLILWLVILISSIFIIIRHNSNKKIPQIKTKKERFLKVYFPIIFIFAFFIFLRGIDTTKEGISDKDYELSNKDRMVVFNKEGISNNSIYRETNCNINNSIKFTDSNNITSIINNKLEYVPVYEGNYLESIAYLNQIFLDLGMKDSNLFKIEKIDEGHGILFITRVSSQKNFMHYCKEISSNFPVGADIDCRYPRHNATTILLTTSFRVINNKLEARYILPCKIA
tara:strand:- start:80 stop:1045 length:966 start_codon:yes stop_codon:yes gene_type:complete